ncbi:MAG: LysR family transcriptional regulator [Altererythrobacter sp.]|nr:LysR family transcriptional regulator [Altererythrobacter sp.]
MSFEFRQLRYAVAAGDSGSFAKAAARLRVKQSTLSRRIMLLEQQIGLRIFDRSTQGAVPTRAGAEFLAAARRIVDEAEGLKSCAKAVGRGEAGRLVVGFSTSLSAGHLRAALSGFYRRYPDVDLHCVEAGWEALMRGIATRAIDVAIIPGKMPDDRLARRHLWPERLMVALPEDHPAAASETIFWTDLRDETFVLPKLDPGPDAADLVRARLRGAGGIPTILMEDVSRENILSFLPVCRYVSLVAETAAGAPHPGVVLREIHDFAGMAHLDFWAWWHPDNGNAALDGFLRLVGEGYPEAVRA